VRARPQNCNKTRTRRVPGCVSCELQSRLAASSTRIRCGGAPHRWFLTRGLQPANHAVRASYFPGACHRRHGADISLKTCWCGCAGGLYEDGGPSRRQYA
jgi:hypothetical protein